MARGVFGFARHSPTRFMVVVDVVVTMWRRDNMEEIFYSE
jgi:hypothetical protein